MRRACVPPTIVNGAWLVAGHRSNTTTLPHATEIVNIIYIAMFIIMTVYCIDIVWLININLGQMKTDAMYAEFGKLVRRHRMRLNLTQDQLADRVGLSRTSITNIEKGRQKVLIHHLIHLAESLQVSPEALLPPIETPQIPPEIERRMDKDLHDNEKDWVRRIVGSGTKGAKPHGESKN
jgi:transcriptional regulator with XRE-family HTH domain